MFFSNALLEPLESRVKKHNLKNFKVFKEPQKIFLPTIYSNCIIQVFYEETNVFNTKFSFVTWLNTLLLFSCNRTLARTNMLI